MRHSLRGRLTLLFLLITLAAAAAAGLFFGLFQLSASAQADQAQSELARACEAIADAYAAKIAGDQGTTDTKLTSALPGVVASALRDRAGVEGGVRRTGDEALAYAYPTYPGGSPKTDEPPAEALRIQAASALALAEGKPVAKRYEASAEILLIAACPLRGPIPALTAWTMTRVRTFAGRGYSMLLSGLGLLLAMLVASAAIMVQLASTWRRHMQRMEATLAAHDVANLPRLPPTGEAELDGLIRALNDVGERLSVAKAQGERMAAQLATGERLAGLGRIAAGVAHEIRNPIAAMRLRAETALGASPEHKIIALTKIIEQIDRLDRLVARLLQGATETRPKRRSINVAEWLADCRRATMAQASEKSIDVQVQTSVNIASLDPEQMRDAVVNLLENAIEAAREGTVVDLYARIRDDALVLGVRNSGVGLSPEIRKNLFEPFVTTRAQGVGLGLAVVREIARGHRGDARLAEDGPDFVAFEITLPCQPS